MSKVNFAGLAGMLVLLVAGLGGCNKTGSLQVMLAPQTAVDAGAQWAMDGGAWQDSGASALNQTAAAQGDVMRIAGDFDGTAPVSAEENKVIGTGDGRIHIIPSLSAPSVKNGSRVSIKAVVKALDGVATVEARIERENGDPWSDNAWLTRCVSGDFVSDLFGLPVATLDLKPAPINRGGVNSLGTMGIWQADWEAFGLDEGYYRVALTVTDRVGHAYTDRSLVFTDPIAGNNAVGTTAYPNGGMRRLDAAGLQPLESGLRSAVIDAVNGYAYFGTGTTPGIVVKVALGSGTASPTRVGAVTLNSGEDWLSSAVIDVANGYAYFGTDTSPGIVVKLVLGAGNTPPARVGALTLDSGEDLLRSAVIDMANGYAYFGTSTSPGIVVKVALGSGAALPTRVGAVSLNTGEDHLETAVIDVTNGYAYFGTNFTYPALVVKVAVGAGATLPTRVGAVSLDIAAWDLGSAVIDTASGYAYFGASTSAAPGSPFPGYVVKVALGAGATLPTQVAALRLNSGENMLHSAAIDPVDGCAYFGTFESLTSPGTVVKVALGAGTAQPTRVGAAPLNSGESLPYSALIDATNGYAYFGTATSPGIVVRVGLFQKGFLKATTLSMPENGDIQSVSFYSHAATGNVRLALYDNSVAPTLLWQSASVANTTERDWLTIPVSNGTPSSLSLAAGTYWLAWQADTTTPVASYMPGMMGSGLFVPMAYGSCPATLDAGNSATPTLSGERWSEYITYDAAPSNPGATAVGLNTVTWIWQDNSNSEIGFKVYDDPGAGPPTTLQITTAADVQSWQHTGLTPNTQYAFQVAAANTHGDSVKTANYTKYTLASPPLVGNNVLCDKSTSALYPTGTMFTFANPAGFGAGTHGGSEYKVSGFKYAWDTSATYIFTGAETDWSSGSLDETPSTSGSYYLHLESLNAENVVGGTLDYGPFIYDGHPTGTVTINGGATYTTSTNVSLSLTSYDAGPSGVADMQFSNDNVTWSGWESVGETKAWSLIPGDGLKTVWVQFRDHSGDISVEPIMDAILLDQMPPQCQSITLMSSGQTVAFQVAFSEDVVNLDAASDLVILSSSGVTYGGVSITGGPQIYAVEIPDIRGVGSLTLAVNTGADVTDLAGNSLVSSVTSAPAVVDVTWILNENTWMTNGPVKAIAATATTTYIGGEFNYVGPYTGGFAAMDATTGQVSSPFPKVNGSVSACASDAFGGWYIGGAFTQVGGLVRNNVAHILSNGSVDASWNPNANGSVQALAVSGTTVYAGGTFTSIGGQPRNNIAALDATTGNATAWDPNSDAWVGALAVSGSTVYAGGGFTSIGGQTRNYIAALDASSGNATAWNPHSGGWVGALAVSGSTVYAGGHFASIGGQLRRWIAALDATTANATPWNPNASGYNGSAVYALAVSGTTVYAGGAFTVFAGQPRNNIAALDATTANATPWNPNAEFWVLALAVSDSTVYAGGWFTSIGGQPRNYIAALDAITGNATPWNPGASGKVSVLAVSGTTVCAGGDFWTIGGKVRLGIAALDATTGIATDWDPGAGGYYPYVEALAVSDSTVYAGGWFTAIGGQDRSHIAALDATTGNATSWNPGASGPSDPWVYALAVSGSTVYAGGRFTGIGGQTRWGIAALDATTGSATAWNPNANGWVNALAVSDSTVYAGGLFTSIGGQPRNSIAALDASTGDATPWNPNANGSVDSLAVWGTTVYAGGNFTNIGGQTRSHIAELNASTGNATAWNPNASGGTYPNVYALALSGTTVYAGGTFTNIGGQTRSYIAALDATTGNVSTWNPNVSGGSYPRVSALAVSRSTLYAGGDFTSVGGQPRYCFAAFVSPPMVQSIALIGVPSMNEARFEVQFGEDVAGFDDESDIVLTTTGGLGYGEVLITGGPRVYTVTVRGLTGTGTLSMAVSTTSDVTDIAGNPLLSSVTSEPVEIDFQGQLPIAGTAGLAGLASLLAMGTIAAMRKERVAHQKG